MIEPAPPAPGSQPSLLNATGAQRYTMLMRMLREATIIASESSDLATALQRTVDQICAVTHWPVGHVYLPAGHTASELSSAPIWCLEQPRRFARLQEVSDATRFAPSVGLVGRVMVTSRPVWVADVAAEPSFIRARPDLGVRGFCAFPVVVGAEVSAVVEFFTAEAAAPDYELLEVLADIGVQLGRVVERTRAHTRLAELQHLCEQEAAAHALAAHRAGMATTRRLATAISHEVNNPLFAARTALTLLTDELDTARVESPYVAILHDELARIAHTIEQMREAARADLGAAGETTGLALGGGRPPAAPPP